MTWPDHTPHRPTAAPGHGGRAANSALMGLALAGGLWIVWTGFLRGSAKVF